MKFYILYLFFIVICYFGIYFQKEEINNGSSFSESYFDRNNELLRVTLSGDEKYRIFTNLNKISPDFVKLTLLKEDKYFFYHPGVNPVSLVKAFVNYIFFKKMAGASTITMQVARIKWQLNTKTFTGKLNQILKSFYLELFYSKSTILEFYFNRVSYGANIEGVGAASLIYFNRKAIEISKLESSFLVLIPKNPTKYYGKSPKDFINEVKHIYSKLDSQMQSDFEYPFEKLKIGKMPFKTPHLINSLSQGGHLTIDLKKQNLLEKIINSYINQKKTIGIKNGAALLIDYNTREILSYIGSNDFYNSEIQGQVNGVLAKRSPGSTLKPFIYALAIDKGLINPLSLLKDSPYSVRGFDPENFDRKFIGPISATRALNESRNVPAVYLLNTIGINEVFQFFKDTNFYFPKSIDHYGFSFAMGGAEMSMFYLGGLYTALANLGELAQLRIYKNKEESTDTKNILSPEASFLTLKMLTENQTDFDTRWSVQKNLVAWKSGTSNGFRDAWAIGVFGHYVLVVWLGNFNNEFNNALIGREVAGPLLFEIIKSLEDKSFDQPSWMYKKSIDIKKIEVCSITGQIPNVHCPHRTFTYMIPAKSPIKKCEIHRLLMISKKSHKRVCNDQQEVISQVFEFWPSDLLNIFEKAGIKRVTPPEFEKDCYTQGLPPQIVSPKKEVPYVYSVQNKEDLNTIGFNALVDGDIKDVFWFLNNSYIGKTNSNTPLYWKAKPGDYTVSVFDSYGRSNSSRLKVEVVR